MNEKKNQHTVRYVCSNCGVIEDIDSDVIDYFDEINPQQLLFGAHEFSCDQCTTGIMRPQNKDIDKADMIRIYEI